MSSRREIAERTIVRWKAGGIGIDEDLEFMSLLDLWIAGTIDSKQMRGRYVSLMRSRFLKRRNGPDLEPTTVETPSASGSRNGTSTDETGGSRR